MELPRTHIKGFSEFIGRPKSAQKLEKRADLSLIRVVLDSAGKILGSANLFNAGEFWAISTLFYRGKSEFELSGLIGEVIEIARNEKAIRIETQVEMTDSYPLLKAALTANQFTLINERIIFSAELNALPKNSDNPLRWVSMAELGIEEASKIMENAVQGDPMSTSSEVALEAIQDFQKSPGFTQTDDIIQIGYLGEKAVAFVCAQVQISSGWSRITYLGVLPEFRNRGFGRLAHLKGLSMLRQQGGKFYIGGTDCRNFPMLKLFKKLGLKPIRQEGAWKWLEKE